MATEGWVEMAVRPTMMAAQYNGLAVHRSIGELMTQRFYSITHVRTGKLIAEFPERLKAYAAAEEMAKLADWNEEKVTAESRTEVFASVAEIVKRHGGILRAVMM